MATQPQRNERRTDALSRERIIEAAIGILDTDGESALTFRALSARLSTGAGAIYWHVANKDELLAAATDAVVSGAMASRAVAADPQEAVRGIASGLFDAIDAHPWVGTQLAREPWQPAVLQVLDAFGGQLAALAVPEDAQFYAASALVSLVLGVAGQYAAGARLLGREADRPEFLARIAEGWTRLDPGEYPFVHRIAPQLAEHDDREQFLAGIDLLLAGVTTLR